MAKPPCLVTGASGFIGSHLVRELLGRGHRVEAVVRPGSSTTGLTRLQGDLELHRFDLDDQAAVRQCVHSARPEIVFHLAAETRKGTHPSLAGARESILRYQVQNLNLLEALAMAESQPRVVIRAGTLAEYGSSAEAAEEHRRERPGTPYAAGMAAGTHYLSMLQDILPFPVTTARLALTYGPGQSESFFIPFAIRAFLEHRSFSVERPQDRRDLINIDDVINALITIARAPPAGHCVLNIATGNAPRMDELALMIAEATGADRQFAMFRTICPGETPKELICSTERTRAMIGWAAKTGLKEGLMQTAIAMRSHLIASA